MIRTVPAVLAAATFAAITLAVLGWPSLWGFALAMAFLTGFTWDREACCDDCDE